MKNLKNLFHVIPILGRPFYFRGCGWSTKYTVSRSKEEMTWVVGMTELFTEIFGDDFLSYETVPKTKVVQVAPESLPVYQYDHARWEGVSDFLKIVTSREQILPSHNPGTKIPLTQGSPPQTLPSQDAGTKTPLTKGSSLQTLPSQNRGSRIP